MKTSIRIFLLLSLIYLLNVQIVKGQDHPINCIELKQNLKNQHIEKYVGETVQSLLDNKCVSNYTDFVLFDKKPGSLSGAYIVIKNCITITVYVDKYRYVKQFNLKRDWNVEDFKKETISKITVDYR